MLLSLLTAALLLLALGAGRAGAAPILGASGLPDPARVAGFEGAARDPGALVAGLSAAGISFSRPLTLSPQRADHIAGMSGASLGSHGDRGWRGELSIRFDDVQTAAAFALATPGAWVEATALLDGKAVESIGWRSGWADPETAYAGFAGIRFDEIRITTDAALLLLDNLQWGQGEEAHAAGSARAAASAARPGARAAAPGLALSRGTAPEPGERVARPRETGGPEMAAKVFAPLAAALSGPEEGGLSAALAEEAEPVPVPAAFGLLSAALAGLGLLRWRLSGSPARKPNL